MGDMNARYGSELHLLRYLGRHRHALHRHIERVIPGRMVDWWDFRFGQETLDAEWTGLGFLPDYGSVKKQWSQFWPQTGRAQHWDAVGWIEVDSHAELLLVEAKANVEELSSSTKASEAGGLPKIQAAFAATRQAMGISADADWLSGYYQYCNRLATLHFLIENSIGARLLFIYFYGDCTPGVTCPSGEAEWKNALSQVYTHVGLNGRSELEKRVHSLFIPVRR